MKNRGFTLIELLVVIAIISILAGVIGSTFSSSQRRGRDAQRKSDLQNIAHALELYYNDYNKYPSADDGKISACWYQINSSGPDSSAICDWGEDQFWVRASDGIEFTDKAIYMIKVPKDPSSQYYYYRTSSGTSPQKYQLYARLENQEDKNIIQGISINCGTNLACNYAVTSTNTTPTENIE
jgi:prepilin-type N-terminal cleavage/methylation domain-containing protein